MTTRINMKIKILKHNHSDLYLYNGQWIGELPKNVDLNLVGRTEDIQQGGKNSQDIIDTCYHSPEDFGKEEWHDEDDTTDDYEEEELEFKTEEIWVKYHNFYPDYSITNHRGGFKNYYESFNSIEEANDYINNLSNNYRGRIIEELD